MEFMHDDTPDDAPEETMALPDERPGRKKKHLDPYQRTRAAVYATGNKWAIENFEATHESY